MQTKKLLFSGWRNSHHSFAMVHQNQLLAALKHSDLQIYHQDMPLLMNHWNAKDHNPGFSNEDYSKILNVRDFNEEEVDCVYRICAPMFPPNKIATRTLTFTITEVGFDHRSLSSADLKPSAYTQDNNLVITSSRWSRDRLIDYGFAEDKVRIVSCGVNTSTFKPLTEEEFILQRSALQIPLDSVVFINVGAPIWTKGIDLLLKAFCRVHFKFPTVRLILKDGQALYGLALADVLTNFEKENPGLLTENVLSAISVISKSLAQFQLRALYGLADWYVSPYRAEGFNLPVLEAQACGTPVIISSGGATDDFCNHPGVKKIASIFSKGTLGNTQGCAWVEPNLDCLVNLMEEAAASGPRTPTQQHDLQRELILNATQFTWDKATDSLLKLMKN